MSALSSLRDVRRDFRVVDQDAPADGFSDDELAALSDEFERAPAQAVIEWAVDTFHPHLSRRSRASRGSGSRCR